MQRFFTLFIFLVLTSTAIAQESIEDEFEIMLLNAQYQRVIERANSIGFKNISIENKKVEAFIRAGKLKEAQQLLDSLTTHITATANTLDIAITEANQGFLYLMQGRNDLSLETLQQASAKFENSSTLEYAKATTYLGLIYFNTRRIAQAEEQMLAALRIRENYLKARGSKAPKEFEEFLAASYNDLGLVYSVINKDKALDYYEKALHLYEKLHGRNHPKIAIASTNIGLMYRELELFGDATNNFETANKIWDKVYAGPHFSKAFVLFNLGETYKKMGDAKAARAYYTKALKMYEDSYGKKHPDVARVENAIGNLDLASNLFKEALIHYQKALQANIVDFNEEDISINPTLKRFYDGNVLLYSLMYKVQALEARYFGKTLRLKDLTLALQTLQTCDTLIDKLRQQITNESDKLMLSAIATEVYADGVRISYETAEAAVKKKPFLELAFYFAEKSKSAILLEAISDTQAKSFAGIPTDLLEEEKSLKSAIALCLQKLAQKPSAEEEKYLREVSFELNRNYEAFIKKLEQQFPEYYNLKFNTNAPTIEQVQSRLEPNTLLLSYFIDDKNSKLYTFQISKNRYEISSIALPPDFDKNITGLRNSLFYSEIRTYATAASKLSKLLIPKRIASNIHELVILPAGRLSIVPFETLFAKSLNDIPDYKSLPYLLNRFNIRYEFSTGLILQKSKKQITNTPSIFLCAPVTFTHTETLSELPATEAEVNDISELFANKNLKTASFIRNEADEKLIKSGTLKDYSYLHFATHGLVDENNPELSRIFLQSSASSEDGNLFAGEIYNLQLNADLVTLSACQTGLGKISKGEGVIGLSRALVYAGAKNCVVSFWSVADESTALLMKEFYNLMLENPSRSLSTNLTEAKKHLMKNNKYAAPFYWAPFILIGF